MRNIYRHLKNRRISNVHFKRYFLIYLGLIIYLLFFISVTWTGWFDIFFSGAALHAGAKGIDFYQLPRGAWAFWHGGSLTGDPLADGSQYAKQAYANGNVYHPLFTLTLGSLLALFDPALSPYILLSSKLLLSLVVIAYFFWRFRASRYIGFAVFILLANFSVYLELAAWQFHFFFNMLLFLLLIGLVEKRAALRNGSLYALGMLVKPVGLLFVPMLLFKGRRRTALLGIGLFALATALFLIGGVGRYYVENLMANVSSSGVAGPNQIISLAALLHFTTQWPDFVYQTIEYSALLFIILLSALRKTHITTALFLHIAFFLCFYNMVFEYHWSSLAYVLAVGVVASPEFQTRFSRFCILLTCLPSCFILLNYLHIDVKAMVAFGLIHG